MFNNPKLAKSVGIFQIVGGVIGIGYFVLLFEQITQSTIHLLVFSFLLIVAIFSLIGGIQLFRQKESGRIISIVVQLIQLPYFSLSPVLFYMGIGISMFLGFNMPEATGTIESGTTNINSGFAFQWGIGVDYLIEIADELEETFFGLNLIALFILIGLFRTKFQTVNDS